VREDLGAAALVHESARRAVRPPDGPADLDALPGLGGVDRAGSGSGWLAGPFRRRSYPFASFNRGIFHFHRREPVRAATAFAEAVRRSEGAYYEIYGNLGAALLATDRLEPARECYRIYLRELPFYRVGPRRRARARLDEIDRRLGD
jgi:tetratricopeptide (TPR) repeat protein